MSDIPSALEADLNLLGVTYSCVVHTTGNNNTAVGSKKPKVERDFTFKMPTLDENGDPPW
jgi:hypothetical protein